MNRPPGWEQRLLAYIDRHRCVPFKLGEHDCVRFVGGWLREMRGADPLEGLPAYSSPAGARRALTDVGFESLSVAVTNVIGRAPVPVLAARRGDIVGLPDETGLFDIALGISAGREVFLPDTGFGLACRPLGRGLLAWRV